MILNGLSVELNTVTNDMSGFSSVLQRFVAVLNSFVLLKSLGHYIMSYEDIARLQSKISNENYCLYLVYIQMLSEISWPFPEEGFTAVVLFCFFNL